MSYLATGSYRGPDKEIKRHYISPNRLSTSCTKYGRNGKVFIQSERSIGTKKRKLPPTVKIHIIAIIDVYTLTYGGAVEINDGVGGETT